MPQYSLCSELHVIVAPPVKAQKNRLKTGPKGPENKEACEGQKNKADREISQEGWNATAGVAQKGKKPRLRVRCGIYLELMRGLGAGVQVGVEVGCMQKDAEDSCRREFKEINDRRPPLMRCCKFDSK